MARGLSGIYFFRCECLPRRLMAALPRFPVELLIRIAAYLPAGAAYRLSVTCRATRAAFDSHTRAAAFIARYGPRVAAERLYWLMTETPLLFHSLDDASWIRDPENREMAVLICSSDDVRRHMADNCLLDIASAGMRSDAMSSDTRFRCNNWGHLITDVIGGNVKCVATNDILRIYGIGDPQLFEAASEAQRSGADLSLDFLSSYRLVGRPFNHRSLRLWEDNGDEEDISLLSVLELCAPPSIQCFDLSQASYRQALTLCQFYAAEIAGSRRVARRVRKALEAGGRWLELAAGLNPWRNASALECLAAAAERIAAEKSHFQDFDAVDWVELMDTGVNLRLLVPERLDQALRPWMHPAMVQGLVSALRWRDSDFAFIEGLRQLADSFQDEIDFHAIYDDWNEPRDAPARLQWRSYFLLGEINALLFELTGRGSSRPGVLWHGRRWRGAE
ncbi:hypothetical protein DFJ74DRAFT_682657 [Hyaloraphidium curvatum]|nr:hypothetical protein DFJ74DRAFT_682657 [Hyaloraphidium curvatum]